MMMGRVDEVDGDFIATRFLAFAIPTRSVYVAHRKPRMTLAQSGDGQVRIQIDWRSVLLAYGRVWLPIIAIGAPVARAIVFGGFDLASVALGLLLLGISVLAHRAGRLPDAEKARLRLLGSVTGLRIDPARLLPRTREIKRDQLGELMEKAGIPITPDTLLAVLEEIPMPAMALVYGYARYAGDDDMWLECAARVYERHEQGEF